MNICLGNLWQILQSNAFAVLGNSIQLPCRQCKKKAFQNSLPFSPAKVYLLLLVR